MYFWLFIGTNVIYYPYNASAEVQEHSFYTIKNWLRQKTIIFWW